MAWKLYLIIASTEDELNVGVPEYDPLDNFALGNILGEMLPNHKGTPQTLFMAMGLTSRFFFPTTTVHRRQKYLVRQNQPRTFNRPLVS
jgi:hypothetical protein